MRTAVCAPLALALALSFGGGVASADKKMEVKGDEGLARSQIEQDIEKYFGKRRKVAVVQRRLYPKSGRWEFSVNFGIIPNDPFVNYLPIGLRITRHIKEWFGLELTFLYTDATSFNSSLADGIRSVGENTPYQLQLTLLEKQRMHFALNAVFSLLYGKVAMLKTSISHFDLFLTAGPSFHLVSKPPLQGTGGEADVSPFRVGGTFGIGMKFFINDFFGIRLDVRQYLFPKSDQAGGGLHKPTEISLGATFFAG